MSTLRYLGEKLAVALCTVAFVTILVDEVTPWAWAALPLLLWLNLRARHEPAVGPEVPWLPEVPENQWLADAYASRQRGTGISTLAVRYDVDPDWLESELARYRQVAIDDRAVVDARRQGAEGVAPVAGQA